MPTITLTNSFHNTQVRVRPHAERGLMVLSKRQVRRAHDALCGSPTCTCGDAAGTRGGLGVFELDGRGRTYHVVEGGEPVKVG